MQDEPAINGQWCMAVAMDEDADNAELRRATTFSLVKSAHVLEILKEYLSFTVARKQQYYVLYKGRMYREHEAKALFEELRGDPS